MVIRRPRLFPFPSSRRLREVSPRTLYLRRLLLRRRCRGRGRGHRRRRRLRRVICRRCRRRRRRRCFRLLLLRTGGESDRCRKQQRDEQCPVLTHFLVLLSLLGFIRLPDIGYLISYAAKYNTCKTRCNLFFCSYFPAPALSSAEQKFAQAGEFAFRKIRNLENPLFLRPADTDLGPSPAG